MVRTFNISNAHSALIDAIAAQIKAAGGLGQRDTGASAALRSIIDAYITNPPVNNTKEPGTTDEC